MAQTCNAKKWANNSNVMNYHPRMLDGFLISINYADFEILIMMLFLQKLYHEILKIKIKIKLFHNIFTKIEFVKMVILKK